MPEARPIVDVGDHDFESAVLERSKQVPVVVDFWAPWCGPCRTLGPVLERLAIEHAGAFVLAKVNVDEAPAVAQAFRIQSIPAVKAFRDGRIVAEFVGAHPESGIRQFLAAVLPSEADALAREGEAKAAANDPEGAAAAFRGALARDATHPGALLGLARIHAAKGDDAEAVKLLERITVGAPEARDADRLAAELRTRVDATGDEATLRARVRASVDDLDARLQLGRLLAARRKYDDALAELLEVVRRDPRHADEAARKAMLDVFAVLGADDPLTDRYRRELASVLFR
ncbi:MAG TPA: tetratricopeptide repeat protein [Candidatus Binatia bacterium]|nr:tetratricopeptide repeat protein [Candidatus Binatia bacterium]